MAKNILLTTLSTKPRALSLNYYYTPSENGPCFCSGISQLEAGSKYILSTIPIHKLVVVGSNETIDPAKATDITESPAFLTTTLPLTTNMPSTETKSTFELYDKLSAYDLYKKRMTAFLSKTNVLDEEAALGNISKNGSIDPNRVAQLKELTNHLLKTYFSNKPDLYPLSQKEVMTIPELQKSLHDLLLQEETDPIDCLFDIVGKLKKAVQENVNNSFLASHDTKEYDTLIKKHGWNAKLLETEQQELLQSYQTFKRNYFIFTSLRNANKTPNNLSFFEEQKKAIEQDTSLSSLARQYLYIQLKDYMDTMQKELMQRDILEIENEVYQLRLEALQLQTDKENLQIEAIDAAKEIAQLKLENKRLQFELQLIKSNRINYETAYVRYYLFSLIQDTNKLQILPENTQIPLVFVPEVTEQELPRDDKSTTPETQDEQNQKNIVTQDNLSGLVDALYEKGETEQIYEKEILTLQKRFLFLYCKFCTMQKYLENRKDHEYSSMAERIKDFTLEQFYYFIAVQPEDTFFQKESSISFTVLSCLNENNYLASSKEYVNELKNFKIQLHNTLNTVPIKETLEELFLLHQALKIERNCNNHASQKGIRLPKPIVERAIKLYVEKFREIQAITDRKK